MISYFRSHLGAKLLLSYLAIILVGVLVLFLASQFLLPASFNRHMAGMGMMQGMMGQGQGFGTGQDVPALPGFPRQVSMKPCSMRRSRRQRWRSSSAYI